MTALLASRAVFLARHPQVQCAPTARPAWPSGQRPIVAWRWPMDDGGLLTPVLATPTKPTFIPLAQLGRPGWPRSRTKNSFKPAEYSTAPSPSPTWACIAVRSLSMHSCRRQPAPILAVALLAALRGWRGQATALHLVKRQMQVEPHRPTTGFIVWHPTVAPFLKGPLAAFCIETGPGKPASDVSAAPEDGDLHPDLRLSSYDFRICLSRALPKRPGKPRHAFPASASSPTLARHLAGLGSAGGAGTGDCWC